MKTGSRFGQILSTPRLFLRAVALTWRADRWLALLTLVLLLFSALIAPVQVWMTKLLLDSVVDAVGHGSNPATAWTHGQNLIQLLVVYVVVWTLGQAASAGDRQTRGLMTMRVDYDLQKRLFRKAAELDIAFYDSPMFFSRLTLARNEKYRIYNVVYLFADFLQTTVTAIALFALLGQISFWIPVILLVTAIPRLWGAIHFTRREADVYVKDAPLYHLTAYLSGLLGEREAVKEIRLFQTHNYLIDRMHRANRQHYENVWAVKVTQEKTLLLLTLIMAAGTAAIWGYAGWQALIGAISVGSVALVLQGVERGRDQLFAFSVTAGSFAENTVYLQALFGFLDLSPHSVAGTLARSSESEGVSADLSGAIEFDHVSFRYPGTDVNILDDVSFNIDPGETVALVGENGAGKTTLVKLLARLYDPTEGRITVAGRDLRQVDPERYYRQIGAIFQDFRHYELSARENIGFGHIPDIDNLAKIRRAAVMGGAAELIEGLPHQYETMLGRLFAEESTDLSGGEWQKIALARAFMRKVPLLILDEPTAALDAFAENAVYIRFAELTQGRTTVFVTHRLASVQMARRILVLKAGRLVETGTHNELMMRNGEYAAMFRLQSERYRSSDGPETEPS